MPCPYNNSERDKLLISATASTPTMREIRKRGIPATEEGRQKLTTAKAAKRNLEDKVWSYLDIATEAQLSESAVKRFFAGKGVDKESAISICKALDLEITEIVDPKELNPPTQTTTATEINWREICTKVLETQHLRRQATAQQYELNIYVPLGLMERPKTPNPRRNCTGEDSPPQKEPELQIVQTYKDDAFFQKVIAENHTEKGKHIAIIGEPGAGKTTLLGELADRLCRGGFVDNPCHPQTAEINPPFPSDTPSQTQTTKGGFLTDTSCHSQKSGINPPLHSHTPHQLNTNEINISKGGFLTDTSCHPQKFGINPPLHSHNENFPICIRLADLRSSTIADYLLNNWLSKALQFIDFEAENVTPEIRKEFKQLFAEGKVWLLLDGVDEMAATSPIEALARIREQLTDWVGKARVVLTCRLNVWDAAISNTLTDFDTYKTLEFEPDDVDEFIRQWFEEASLDEKRRNSGNETFWREQGKRLTTQLKSPGKERIKELVRNPLRLSMLCQSWCVPEQELPETKAALYEQFTTYFFEWKQEEFSKKQRVLTEEDKTQIEQALAKLALAAMSSVNRFRIEQDFAIEQMEEVWFNLADEWGWLVLVDRDTRTQKPVYAFFHPTFQEYFAACAIEDWHFFLNHQIPPVSDCSYRIFERQWREVILLWLGRREIEGKHKRGSFPPVIMYHEIRSEKIYNTFDVSLNSFKRQLDWLQEQGFVTLSLDDLQQALAKRQYDKLEKAVVLTFDDGYRGNFDIAAPILRQRQMKATFFIHLKALNNQAQPANYPQINWQETKVLDADPLFSVYSHTVTHPAATANLNIANLPQVLAEAINNQPELCSKVKLICIDTHQIIDPENPAPEIYDQMLNQKCPEWQNGYPETMQKLKLYWNYLRRNSENPPFFICYDSTALTATPTGFSDTFLTALSKFDGAICVVTSPPNPLWATERGSKNNSPSSVAGEGGFCKHFHRVNQI